MADLNFPKDRTELVPPGTGALQTGDTYTANGTTWVYDATVGAWGSGTGAVSETIYLSRVNDDSAEGEITFEKATTHEAGVKVTGGDTTNSLYAYNNGLYIGNDEGGVVIGGSAGATCQSQVGTVTTASTNATGIRGAFGFGSDYTSVSQFRAVPGSTYLNSGSANQAVGFIADSTIAHPNATTGIGFLSTLAGTDNYNFYASGSAPNYFAGDVLAQNYIKNYGGVLVQDAFGDDSWTVNPPADNKNGIAIRRTGQLLSNLGSTANPCNIRRNNDGKFLAFSANNNTEIGNIRMAGGAIAGPSTSDYRSKNAITPLPSATAQVKALNPVSFEYNHAPGYTHTGFVAHELQDYVSEAVFGTKDEEEAIGTFTTVNGVVTICKRYMV